MTGQKELYDIFELIYPVGIIIELATNANPKDLFGIGEWEQIKDRFILAAGNSYAAGSTGGASTHTHNYGLQFGGYYRDIALESNPYGGLIAYDANGTTTVVTATSVGSYEAPINGNTTNSNVTQSMGHYRSTANTSYTSNMPPYYVAYLWRRVS